MIIKNAKEKYIMAKIKKLQPHYLLLILLFNQLTSCQMKKELPQFHVEMCHPENRYDVTPIFDSIKTLEGIPAGLPYGSSSGR